MIAYYLEIHNIIKKKVDLHPRSKVKFLGERGSHGNLGL